MTITTLPPEIWLEIWEYDGRYRRQLQETVLPELQRVVTARMVQRMNAKKDEILAHDAFCQASIQELYDLLTGGAFNLQLLRYDPDFHFIDQAFFNYSILKKLWVDVA